MPAQQAGRCLPYLPTSMPCFITLSFFALYRYYNFLQIEHLWQPCIEQIYWHNFSNICSLRVSVSHFSNSHNISKFFVTTIFVMVVSSLFFSLFLKNFYFYSITIGCLFSPVFDVTVVIVWECHKPHPHKVANLTHKCCTCSDCFTDQPLPPHPCSLGTTIWKLGQLINNPTMASECSSERKSHISLILNQKLRIMKLSKESMSKAEIG